MRDKFTGVGVALITPFNEDLSIDYPALKNLLNHISNSGIDYLVVNGTTSEASTISLEDKATVLAFVQENNPKKLPIMYGLASNDTMHVLDLIKKTDFSHIDAILTVSPYYNKPSQGGIIAHYETVANASPVPVLLYNVPGRTGINVTTETILHLANHPNIFGIKEASGDLSQCIEIMAGKPDDFMLISGDDLLTLAMISIGAEGVISVLANAYAEFTTMIHEGLNGDFGKAKESLFKFVQINDHLYAESNPVGIKEVLKNLGLCDNYVRLPLLPASNGLAETIKQRYNLFS